MPITQPDEGIFPTGVSSPGLCQVDKNVTNTIIFIELLWLNKPNFLISIGLPQEHQKKDILSQYHENKYAFSYLHSLGFI